MPTEEPVITEINDEDEPTISGSIDTVSEPLDVTVPPEDVAVEPIASSSPQLQPDDASIKDLPNDQLEPNYEPIENESDIQILVPQISVLDLDEFEEKPVDADEVSAAPVAPVKIKQEPKDDYEEDDGFEDVGTFEVASVIDDDSRTFICLNFIKSVIKFYYFHFAEPADEEQKSPATVPILQTPQSMITSLDGNVQLQDTQPALATNRIKINITKNVTKPSTAADVLDKANEAADAAAAAAQTAAALEPEQEITFEYKSSMRSIAFKKLPPVLNGVDTSGLCSIM